MFKAAENNKKTSSTSGFTLVELAIVLVIIGLVVGGVLVGADLIRSAEVRAVIGRTNEFKTAYLAFMDKYDCLPGDCRHASKFFSGFQDGDGNKLIQGTADGAPVQEHSLAFMELHEAGFIRARGTGGTTNFEPTKLRDCQLFLYAYLPSYNRLYGGAAGNYIRVTRSLEAAPWHEDCMYPNEAYELDVKLDDGYASTGRVRSVRYGMPAENNLCADKPNDAGRQLKAIYNRDGEEQRCTPYIRFD